MKRERRAGVLAAILAAAPLLVTSCTSKPVKQLPPPSLTITPAADSKDVPVSTEIGISVSGGNVTDVTLTDSAGTKIEGAMRPDGSSWVPNAPLKFKESYTAQVTAANEQGRTSTQTTTFTTMAKPKNITRTTLHVQNGQTYGVAMPMTIDFNPGVPKEARAEVQRRLFITTDPPQPGVWHWTPDGRQVYYRGPDFWKPGTKVSIRAALGGVPMGNGSYGDTDRTAEATIGRKVTLEIDGKTKKMKVFKDDKLIRTIPVSLGKPSTPTSSGKMVIMEKFEQTVFDTTGSPDPYVITVQDAQRLTWGGEFIHSAPWSVGAQGYANVSHGCTNVSPENARWLMKTTHIGDLVTITGTEVKLQHGNGWTAWNLSWEEYIKGSALPVPDDLKEAGKPSPSPSGEPSGEPEPTPSSVGR
ncbi:MAG TPA: Ig-like domain-containing protein [Micromonospora sp.]